MRENVSYSASLKKINLTKTVKNHLPHLEIVELMRNLNDVIAMHKDNLFVKLNELYIWHKIEKAKVCNPQLLILD
jgi:hypothetical protein